MIIVFVLVCDVVALFMALGSANCCVSSVALPVKECLRANETFSTFLLNNSSLPPESLDQLMKAHLNFQVCLLLQKDRLTRALVFMFTHGSQLRFICPIAQHC